MFTLVRDNLPGAMGHQALYKADREIPVLNYEGEVETLTRYVVVSGLDSAVDHGGPETMVFPADENGKVFSYKDMVVIYANDHAAALQALAAKMLYAIIASQSRPITEAIAFSEDPYKMPARLSHFTVACTGDEPGL